MPVIAFTAETVYTPEPLSDAVVLVEDERIRAVGPRAAVELPGGVQEVRIEKGAIAPGFLDIHNHGGGGRDVMEATPEALQVICRTLARFGTTSFYPTTMTAPAGDIRRAAEFLADAIEQAEQQPAPAAQPLGIHMEGPYLSEKRRGAQPAEHLVEPTLEAYRQFAQAAQGRLRIMTIAPELAHAREVIEEMVRTDVHPSMGHSDATYEQAEQAVQLGVRQATHMFNAMRPFAHRDPGIIAKILNEPSVKAELIADGVHVDARAMELLYRVKGPEGIVLITDGISAVGMPDGEYAVGGLNVVVQEGVCWHEGHLAGSVLTMDRAVRNMRELAGATTADAIRMATLNTARLMGVEERKGCLKAGADADLVILDEALHVQRVYARGQLVQ